MIGIVILLWAGYLLSFSNTFELKNQYLGLKKEQELFTNISQKLIRLKQQNAYYDSILRSKQISTESSFQNNLLKTITSLADTTAIKVVNFNNPHTFKTDNALINTFSFTLKGSFSKITQLIYQLEQHYKLGKVISVNFEKKKNYRRNSYFLECTILLQQVQQE
ncbi:MAG: hypothetical protein L3J20_01865 [Flavobacteriaceae bacterium]|nr:hypothetical protein [Flavobacteriaceae bacterium]